MVDNKKIAVAVLAAVGGKENVISVTHCMTRLRFNLKEEGIINSETIKSIEGVVGIIHAGGQIQVVIGQNVPKVYAELCKIGEFQIQDEIDERLDKSTGKRTWKSIGNGILNYLSGSMTPIIPIMLVAGMFRALVAVLGPGALNVIAETDDLYILFNLLYDAGFYFLPIFIGYSAAKKMGASPMLGLMMGAILISPQFVEMAATRTAFTVFGIPTVVNNYTQSVVPVILSVWALYHVEKLFKKVIPDALSTLFVPFLTMLIMVPLSLSLLAPAGAIVGSYISNGLIAFGDVGGFLALALVAALWQYLVMTGMHLVLIAAGFTVFMEVGHEDFILVCMAVAFWAAIGMAVGAVFRLKDKDEKSLSLGYLISGVIGGVTEPTIYGIGLKYKRPFIGMTIGAIVGGAYAGLTNVGFYVVGAPSFLTPLSFVGIGTANLVNGTLSCVIAVTVSAIVVYFTGFSKDDILAQKQADNNSEIQEANEKIYAPIHGTYIPIEEIPDPVFSNGIMGKGCGINPIEGKVFSPVNGIVSVVADTKHAIGITTDNGAEVLIHVGMDTVDMNGKGFDIQVTEGDKVVCGKPLMYFDMEEINKAGHSAITAFVVTNSDDYTRVEFDTGKEFNLRSEIGRIHL